MTFKKAKKLSIMKWEFLSKRGFHDNIYEELNAKFPELKDLSNSCGFCEYFKVNSYRCKCLLEEKWGLNCFHEESLYYRWSNIREDSKKLAKRILEDIKNCHE